MLPLVEKFGLPPVSAAFESLSQTPLRSLGEDLEVSLHVFPSAAARSLQPASSHPGRQHAAMTPVETAVCVNQMVHTKANAQVITSHDELPLSNFWVTAARYTSRAERPGSSEGVTLVLSHACGMHKESWEPVINKLLDKSEPGLVKEVWSLDFYNHGDAALLNRERLINTVSYADYARDIAQFLLLYLPVTSDKPPFLLRQQPLSRHQRSFLRLETSRHEPLYNSWRGHRIVVAGHSIGATSASICTARLSSILAGFILVEPTIASQPKRLDSAGSMRIITPFAASALERPQRWASREEAKKSLLLSLALFSKWTPEAVDTYVRTALYENEQGQIELKCSGYDEALSFCDAPRDEPPAWLPKIYDGYRDLFRLGSHMRVHFVLAHRKSSICKLFGTSDEDLMNATKHTHASLTRTPTAGHLLVQEQPEALAHDMLNVLGRWFAEQSLAAESLSLALMAKL